MDFVAVYLFFNPWHQGGLRTVSDFKRKHSVFGCVLKNFHIYREILCCLVATVDESTSERETQTPGIYGNPRCVSERRNRQLLCMRRVAFSGTFLAAWSFLTPLGNVWRISPVTSFLTGAALRSFPKAPGRLSLTVTETLPPLAVMLAQERHCRRSSGLPPALGFLGTSVS